MLPRVWTLGKELPKENHAEYHAPRSCYRHGSRCPALGRHHSSRHCLAVGKRTSLKPSGDTASGYDPPFPSSVPPFLDISAPLFRFQMLNLMKTSWMDGKHFVIPCFISISLGDITTQTHAPVGSGRGASGFSLVDGVLKLLATAHCQCPRCGNPAFSKPSTEDSYLPVTSTACPRLSYREQLPMFVTKLRHYISLGRSQASLGCEAPRCDDSVIRP